MSKNRPPAFGSIAMLTIRDSDVPGKVNEGGIHHWVVFFGIKASTTLALNRQLPAWAFSVNSNKPFIAVSRDGRSPPRFQ